MPPTKLEGPCQAALAFDIEGKCLGVEPYGSGHIHDTFLGSFRCGSETRRYIHQRLNHTVFKNPIALMENIERVTNHLHEKLRAAGDREHHRKSLTLIPARGGDSFYRDQAGYFWRTYLFIENAVSHDSIESPGVAEEAGRAFGTFQSLLIDLPPPRLHESIPDFHHTPRRFQRFYKVLSNDLRNRAATAKQEIEFVLDQEPITHRLLGLQQEGKLPERVTHSDTKINNLLVDCETGEGVCVIDLDTVMPGLALYDFGDLVRTATSSTEEDEQDLSKVKMQMPLFQALARGYLEGTQGFLTPVERDLLAFSGRLITFEIGLRFLTDYLEGDVYFKIHREHQNLDRCRSQLALVRSIESQEDEMNHIVESLSQQLTIRGRDTPATLEQLPLRDRLKSSDCCPKSPPRWRK